MSRLQTKCYKSWSSIQSFCLIFSKRKSFELHLFPLIIKFTFFFSIFPFPLSSICPSEKITTECVVTNNLLVNSALIWNASGYGQHNFKKGWVFFGKFYFLFSPTGRHHSHFLLLGFDCSIMQKWFIIAYTSQMLCSLVAGSRKNAHDFYHNNFR